MFLVVMPTPTQALSYTDTIYDFQGVSSLATTDIDGIGSNLIGVYSDCNRDLNASVGWDFDSYHASTYGTSANTSVVYEGNASTYLYGVGTPGASHCRIEKKFGLSASFDRSNIWIAGAIYVQPDVDQLGQIHVHTRTPITGYSSAGIEYSVYNSSFSLQDSGDVDRVLLSRDGGMWVYFTSNVTKELTDSGGVEYSQSEIDAISQIRVRLYENAVSTSSGYALFDSIMLIGHEDANYDTDITTTGSAVGFHNTTGLYLETGSGESAYARIDYNDFSDRWDYGVKVTYGGTGTSTNISSSLNIDEGGWSNWNHTIATLGNDTFIYYTTNQSYRGEDIAGRYVDIDCPASSSIIIQSLTIREGYPSGGGGIGGGGGGVAPETVVSEVVEGFTTRLFGIQYWQLLLGFIGIAFIGHKYTKKKIHYKVPKQNLVFISGISAILLVFFWFSLSVFYMEAPAETLKELPFEFYIFGFGVAVTILFGSLPIKMQGIERAPNKLVFKSNDFANSVVKGIILLTSISFVLYYLLNLAFGFTADTFLVTQFQMEIIYAFQLGTTTVWFLHFVLPWIEEIVFRYVTLLIVAPFTDETGRCIFSAAVFGAFHYYVARTIGFAYFIYFFAGGLIFYSICYGTIWLEKYWKGMPKLLKFKGAGLLAAIIVHLIFNFMSLYGANLLQTAWVVEI